MNKKNMDGSGKKPSFILRALDHEKWGGLAVAVLSIIFTLIAASVLLLVLGKNPIQAFIAFLQGSGLVPKPKYGGGQGILTDLTNFLNVLSPMILASLAFIFAFKAGLFNIGIAGQMLLSGFVSTIVVGYSGLGSFIAKPLVILIGIAVGGLYGAVAGYLKYKFNIHEVVSTIMLNHIANYTCGFFINSYFADPMTRNMTAGSAASRLTISGLKVGGVKCVFPIGLILAIIAAFIVKFIIDKTAFGLEIRAVGTNPKAAKYTGIKVGQKMVLAMSISGMLAGLAGAAYYLGYASSITPLTLPDMGYDAIAVALLGNSSPIGAIFAAILISVFQQGATYLSSNMGVAKEIASLITGILLLFSACGGFYRYVAHRKIEQLKDAEALAAKEKKEGGANNG